MRDKPTPWKLDRPYDPDERAEALRRRFSRYRRHVGAVGGSASSRFWPVWLLIAAAVATVFAIAT